MIGSTPRRHPAPRLRRQSSYLSDPSALCSLTQMSNTPWLQLGKRTLHLEELPALLERSNLLMPLFRRLLLETSIAGIQVSEEEQMKCQQSFLAQNGIDDEDKLKNWLSKNQISEEQASRNILESLQLEQFKNQRFGSEIERQFLDTKEKRDRVVYSLLRVKEREAAHELYLRLEEGDATFTELSEEHSQGPERETGGLIGPLPLSRLHPELAELLRISSPGQLWRPIEIDGWWVIVRLDKCLPAQLDEAMEKQIRDESFERWLQDQLSSLLLAYKQAAQDLPQLETRQSQIPPPLEPKSQVPPPTPTPPPSPPLSPSTSEQVSDPSLSPSSPPPDQSTQDDSPQDSKPNKRFWPFKR